MIFQENFPVLRLIIKDKGLERAIREKSYKYLVELAMASFYRDGDKKLSHFYSTTKIESNVPNYIDALLNFEEGGDTLFRGIPRKDYSEIIKRGNTKNAKNITNLEAQKLKERGLNPENVMYAASTITKAWEYIDNKNDCVMIYYRSGCFDHITNYLFSLKPGCSFKDAVKFVVFTIFT